MKEQVWVCMGMYETEGNACVHEETYTRMMKTVLFQITEKKLFFQK